MRLVFMGSPQDVISPLDQLLALQPRHQLLAVVSQPARPVGRKGVIMDPPLAAYAKERGLRVLQPGRAKDPDFLSELRHLAPDVIVTAAYGQILTQDFLNIPKRATINIHPSLLPKYRGATPVPAALLNGDQETGVSILFTVKALDAGPLIIREAVTIGPGETAGTLTQRLFALGGKLLSVVLEKLEDPGFAGTPQDENMVSYCGKITKADGRIDWQQPAEMIYNRYRAFQPWPGSFTFLSDKRISITKMKFLEKTEVSPEPGSFRYDSAAKELQVRAGAGLIGIESLKPAGKGDMPAAAFYNGLKSGEPHIFR